MSGKRICIIGKFPPYYGGIATHNYYLAKAVLKKHELLAIGYKRFYPQYIDKKNKTANNYNLATDEPFFDKIINVFKPYKFSSWKKSVKLILKFKPDIVIFPWWYIYLSFSYIFLLKRLSKNKIKSVILCHNVFLDPKSKKEKLINYLFFSKHLTKQVFLKTSFFIVPSKGDEQKILSFHPSPSIIKSLHPVYTFRTEKPFIQNNDQNIFRLLFFGYIKYSKGVDVLLSSISILKEYNIHLTIVGEVSDSGILQQYTNTIKKYGLSRMVQIINNYIPENKIENYFLPADVVVLPYREGTSSGVIATAYGFGKPVIITNVGGLPDAVENKKTGLIVEPDPNSLAEGIIWFINNRNINFRNNIDIFIKKNMSWDSLVDKIESFV